MSFVCEVVSVNVVKMALLVMVDVTVEVGEGVDVILTYNVDTVEVGLTIEDSISGLIEVEYVAELLNSMARVEVVGMGDMVLVGTIELEECLVDDRHLSLLVMFLMEKTLVSAA